MDNRMDNSTQPEPTQRDQAHPGGPRIIYTREQLLALRSMGRGSSHKIPKELKKRMRGCRAGVRHREMMIFKKAKEQLAALVPLMSVQNGDLLYWARDGCFYRDENGPNLACPMCCDFWQMRNMFNQMNL